MTGTQRWIPSRSGGIGRIARRAHREFRDNLTTGQRSALVACATFAATMTAVRGLTSAIHDRRLPLVRDISVSGVHIHHYLPGIALLTVAGAAGVRGSDRLSVHCLLGASYGAGCGLVVDELPLLLNLRDVYWSREGRWAPELGLTLVAVAGAYFSAIPFWQGLREELSALREQGAGSASAQK